MYIQSMTISRNARVGWALSLIVGLIFWALAHYALFPLLNYTLAIGSALLDGRLGVTYAPSWLNELVPWPNGLHYSVFPLGAVISMLPFSALVHFGVLPEYPVPFIVALVAAACAGLAYAYTLHRSDFTHAKRVMLALWLVAGTWYLTNVVFAGSWHIALGVAVAGELAALYWSVVKPRPLLAGLGLAIAFGNRTEVILTAPIILAYLLRPHWTGPRHWLDLFKKHWPVIAKFAVFPLILGILTLIYNQARFGAPLDFGYARIPGVLDEPWYQAGIFSLSAIPDNARQMLIAGFHRVDGFPWPVPTGWGGSIFLASPFLLLLFRKPRGDKFRVITAWLAVVLLTLPLWVHGNTGGWQYSYRYALVLLPWLLVLFVEYLPRRVTKLEAVLFTLSLIMTAYASYLFLFTTYLN